MFRVRLYKHKDPDQPIVFSGCDREDTYGLIKHWMDTHEMRDDVDGLCLFRHDPARFLSTAHNDIVCIEWDGGYGYWNIRRGHDVDNLFSTWHGARTEFLSEVIRHAKHWDL